MSKGGSVDKDSAEKNSGSFEKDKCRGYERKSYNVGKLFKMED
jgi:hypothetical protein